MVQVSVQQTSNLVTSPSLNMPLACTIRPAGMKDTEWNKWRLQHCNTFYDDSAVEPADAWYINCEARFDDLISSAPASMPFDEENYGLSMP